MRKSIFIAWCVVVAVLVIIIGYKLISDNYNNPSSDNNNDDDYVGVYSPDESDDNYANSMSGYANLYITSNQTAYYHLGEDVSISHSCNGTSVSSGSKVPFNNDTTITTTITEYDSIPDSNTINVCLNNLTSDELMYGVTYTGDLTVYENGGTRYPDAYATWYLEYEFVPY
ncbi:MAG: hypothetical protein JJE03_03030 [Peptostreptococcaceae bacterium]|nr:hypothetical protein [Peptostreptococcaceae bacterium]